MSVLLTYFYHILEKSIFGTCCILFILLFRFLLKRFPKVFSYCLWAVAGFRLLFSFSFHSIFSLIRLRPERILTSEVWEIPVIQVQNLEPIPSGNLITTPTSGGMNPAITADMEYAVAGNSLSLLELLSLIWLMGFLVVICYSIFRYLYFNLKLKRMELHELSYGHHENIYEVQGLSQAFTMGILKPRIYLPKDMREESRKLVILHEYTHIKRKDFLFKPLGFIICCLHWFNPLVWLGFSLFCRDMEMSCDESVIRQLDGDVLSRKKDYSNVLLSMAESTPLNRIPLFFGEPGVRQRIKNVLAYKKRTVICSVMLFVILLAAAFCLLAGPGAERDTDTDFADNWAENNSQTENQEDIQSQMELTENELRRIEEEIRKEEAAIKEAESEVLKNKYAVMIEQNQEWMHRIFSYSYSSILSLDNDTEYYVINLDSVTSFSDHISDFNMDESYAFGYPILGEDLFISSFTRSKSDLTITFENGENLKIDATAVEDDTLLFSFNRTMTFACTDLNMDGEPELMCLMNLGYNGGDGGYGLLVYTHTPEGWMELSPPEDYIIDQGFPMQFVWNGSKMYLTDDGITDNGLASYSQEDLIAINNLHGFSEEETLEVLSNEQNLERWADALSGFNIYYKNDEPILVTKQYVSGIFGHVDCFGYLIHEWRLSKDNTWTVQAYFLLV